MKTTVISSKDLQERWDATFLVNKERLKESIANLKDKYTKDEVTNMLEVLKSKFKKNLQPRGYDLEYEIKKYPYECLALVIESLDGIQEKIKKEQEGLQKEIEIIGKLTG